MAWLNRETAARGLTLAQVPFFPSAEWNTVEKADMVSTFEAAAVRCGSDILSPAGARLFGGHSLG